MEVWQNIGNWSPGIAFGMACLWFFNFIVTKFLEDKSEWNDTLEKLVNRYDTRLVESTTALVTGGSQDHQLRGKVQEAITKGEVQYMTITDTQRAILDIVRSIDNRMRGSGGGSDD